MVSIVKIQCKDKKLNWWEQNIIWKGRECYLVLDATPCPFLWLENIWLLPEEFCAWWYVSVQRQISQIAGVAKTLVRVAVCIQSAHKGEKSWRAIREKKETKGDKSHFLVIFVVYSDYGWHFKSLKNNVIWIISSLWLLNMITAVSPYTGSPCPSYHWQNYTSTIHSIW